MSEHLRFRVPVAFLTVVFCAAAVVGKKLNSSNASRELVAYSNGVVPGSMVVSPLKTKYVLDRRIGLLGSKNKTCQRMHDTLNEGDFIHSMVISAGDNIGLAIGFPVAEQTQLGLLIAPPDQGPKDREVVVVPSSDDTSNQLGVSKDLSHFQKRYNLHEHYEQGACGEVWRATSRLDGSKFILKRIFSGKGPSVRLSGLREAHFGVLLKGLPNVARFVEYFTVQQIKSDIDELWLVFLDEGISLKKIIFSPTIVSGSVMWGPSKYWRQLRSLQSMKLVMSGILQGLAQIHGHNVTHRDVKPGNILVLRDEKNNQNIFRIADFGSGVDDFSITHLYGSDGPTRAENTKEYMPPEVLLEMVSSAYFEEVPYAYDIWAAGVTFLEIYLGTDKPFGLPPKKRILLDHKARMRGEKLNSFQRQKMHTLAALEEFCIVPRAGDLHEAAPPDVEFLPSPTLKDCNFASAVRSRDPLRFDNSQEGAGDRDDANVVLDSMLDLVEKMLAWPPQSRITAHDALGHPFLR